MSLALWLGMCHCVVAQDSKSTQLVSDEEIIASGKLPRFEPLSPEAERDSFEVADGFRVELVAAEPLVVDPVAFCFDERGRLIVVEMRGYSERAASKTGRVRRLTDTDHDGLMDEAETLIEGLEWPTAVACWGDGIVIGVAPDILYLPLAEDGNHGPPQKLFSGFGKSNVQGLFNSFQWGPDLRLHCATSSSGALVKGETIDGDVRLGRRDFTIDYHTHALTPVVGGGQHGMSFDRWGNKFVCSNSDHLQQVLLLPRVPQRAATYDEPPLRRSIAADGPQAEVFRSSPVEPWRILRTHLRVNGLARGPVEGGGRAAGYFTGATGIHLYEGDQWPADQWPHLALVCDVGSNLIHRKRLTAIDDLWFRGERVDEGTEFLRSTDTWFRPVQLGGGPDGALYVADMYREVIEHPKSLPSNIKSQVDLNSGNDRGRIWRVVSKSSRPRTRITPAFDANDTNGLVDYLGHPNLWHRRTAARLLVQNQDLPPKAIDRLRQQAIHAPAPETRLESLAVLGRIPAGFDASTRDRALGDPNGYVCRRSLRLAIENADRLPQTNWTGSTFDDPVYRLDFLLIYGSAVLASDPGVRLMLLEGKSSPDDKRDPWWRWAIQGSLTPELLKDRFEQAYKLEPELTTLQALASGDAQLTRRLIDEIEKSLTEESFAKTIDVLAGVADRLRRDKSTEPLERWILDRLVPRLTEQSVSGGLDQSSRSSLRLLGWARADQARGLLTSLLSPERSSATQQMAIEALASNDKAVSELLLAKLPELTPPVQLVAWQSLRSHQSGLLAIASAIDGGTLRVSEVPAFVGEAMRLSRDARIRAVIPEESDKRIDFGKYQAVLDSAGESKSGEVVFQKHCASCHAPAEGATQVGPPLKSIVDKTPEQILISILDPNREVDPKYYRVRVLTDAGRIIAGILLSESDSNLMLVDEKGKRRAVARHEIESLRTVTQSLMPTNFADEISPEQMRDLIAFLKK